MQKEPKKIPFDARNLENMIHNEFVLMTFNPKKIKYRIDDKDYKKPDQELKERIKDGLIGEVISRKPNDIEFYDLGVIESAICRDGIKLSKKAGESVKFYIFTLQNVKFPDGKPPIMRGKIRAYDLCGDRPQGNEYNVTLTFAENPTYKQKSGMMCL